MSPDENLTEQFPRPTEVLPGLPTRRPPRRRKPQRGLPMARPWLVPAAIIAIGLVIVILLVVVIVRLAAPDSPAAVASPSPTPKTSLTPTSAAAAPPPADAAAPRPEPGPNECVDVLGDGALMDLDTASLSRDGGDLVARFTLATPIPPGETALGVTLQSRSGQRVYQVGIAWVDGRLDEYFVHDFDRGDQDDLEHDDVDVAGTQVIARFPDDMLKRLGNGWAWSAFATAAGSELDGCPDAPEVLTFDTNDADSTSGPGNSDRD